MASRADQLASNLSLAKFSQATDLKKRLWFTLGALIVFRFLSFVPLPGVALYGALGVLIAGSLWEIGARYYEDCIVRIRRETARLQRQCQRVAAFQRRDDERRGQHHAPALGAAGGSCVAQLQ